MLVLPPEHPQRALLSDEVHARPPSALQTPSRITHVSCLIDAAASEAEARHIGELCQGFAVEWPGPRGNHFSARLGELAFTWERHGEFSGYTFTLAGTGEQPAASLLPVGWLSALPGQTLVAIHAVLVREPEGGLSADLLAAHFGTNTVIGAEIAGGAGIALTDFRIHAGGYSRIVLLDRSLTERQAGRSLQRLFEVEVYRMLALLALPIAQRQLGAVAAIEGELASLTRDIAAGAFDDETLLQHITALAGRVESELVASQFRFGACRAYSDLVLTRIAELRERRLAGMQTVGEFMERRFKPAVATCATVAQRLHGLSEQVARTSTLLSTRVDIARERQNQALLASMDRRAKMQLRLQQAVEGLSVAAIVYYVAGLIGYLAKGLKARGASIDADVIVAVAIPIIAILVLYATNRARRRAIAGERP
jgi:uncharacterized membrane-anchored protein